MWKKLWIGKIWLNIYVRLFVFNVKRMEVSPLFRDISTIRRRGRFIAKGIVYWAWKDSGNRTGDTDTPIQEAKHRLINEAGKNDEITSVEREREIGTPLVSSESSCCARELVPRTYILLEAWTRGSADGLKLLSERILRSSMKVKHVRYTFLFNQQNSLRCWRKFWLGKLFSSLCSRSFQKSPQNIKFFSTEIWSNEISDKVEAILASSRETGKKRMNSEPSRLSFVIWRERRYFCGQFSPHLLFASTSCLRDCYSSSV